MSTKLKHWSLVAAIALGPTSAVIAVWFLAPEKEPISFWQILLMCAVTGGCS